MLNKKNGRQLLNSSDFGSDEEELLLKDFHVMSKRKSGQEEETVRTKQRKRPKLAGAGTQEQWAAEERAESLDSEF